MHNGKWSQTSVILELFVHYYSIIKYYSFYLYYILSILIVFKVSLILLRMYSLA